MNTKKHFVFDLDGTSADSYKFNQDSFVEAFAPYLDIKNKVIENYIRELNLQSKGTPMLSRFEKAIKHFSINVDSEQMAKENEKLQAERSHEILLFHGVETILKLLKQQKREVSICTNRDGKSTEAILRNNNVFSYFTNVISCPDEGHSKPDPYCLNKIIEESNASEKDFIYFGDSKEDYEFAKAAGVDFIIIDHYLNEKKFYKMIIESFI
jgi:phosphoglycolate phosphatase